MAGTNLTLGEARERGDLLDVASYHIALDLTDGAGNPGTDTFRSVTEVKFSAKTPGASTFIDLIAADVRAATLNGTPLDVSNYDPEVGLRLEGLNADNVLVVDADCRYMNTGEGLHRFVDPVDDEVYLYSQFETGDAKRVYACFDQPDLKATFTLEVTAPEHWEVVSNSVAEKVGAVVKFAPTPRMSTYITALVAGPYHKVTDVHDDIPLGLYCRQSLKTFLDPAEIFEITKQGFDFFHEHFGVRYPFGKYDQLFVPEFNAGAMENAGCVTISESYVFRGKVTDYVRENRANTILHEMAHMWFGDLVTMRWWDDLWLNESFAEWAAHWAAAGGTRFTDSWAAFCTDRKGWGYRQDQLSSTHPIACDIPDMQAVEVNFDGITYAKGASVLKQLVAYVGEDDFVSGLRSYFKAHAFGNTTLADLLTALTEASGRDLSNWSAQWLETAGVNTLRPDFALAPDGTYASFAVTQDAPPDHATLRSHRIAIGLYDLSESTGRLIRRRRVETDIHGPRTEVAELVGEQPPAVVLLNDDDLTYAKIRLDEQSLATVVDHIGGFTEALPRSLLWATAWDMCRDAELPTRDYVRLVLNGLAAESTISVVETQLRQVRAALASYADPAWAPSGYELVAEAALERLRTAEPGSDVQLVWARTFAGTARTEAHLAYLRALLDGTEQVTGLDVDTELRWDFLQSLVGMGAAGEAEIAAELERDPTDQGNKEAATARALVPTAEAKAQAWHLATEDDTIPNQVGLAVIRGFGHPNQAALLEPYTDRFFAVVADVWARRTSEVAQNVAVLLYPAWAVTQETVERTDAWLASADHPPALRRLVVEGKDRLVRALRARACDASAAS
ncbi:aminopeptidase N [Cryptosporangium minutisporangium]|uniref:Aminopeptidase N n=1 Tax=Cryptosporangium minutisporangium TaxID=113569 RepID=A0ABP6T6H5_9ACTN